MHGRNAEDLAYDNFYEHLFLGKHDYMIDDGLDCFRDGPKAQEHVGEICAGLRW